MCSAGIDLQPAPAEPPQDGRGDRRDHADDLCHCHDGIDHVNRGGAGGTIGTAFLATLCSTAAGIAAVKTLERLRAYRLPTPAPTSPEPDRPAHEATATHPAPLDADSAPATAAQTPLSLLAKILLALFVGCFIWFLAQLTFPLSAHDSGSVAASSALVRAVTGLSLLAIPFLVAFFPLYAALRRIPVYEEFVEGAKEGFHVAVRIIPYLVAMLVAIGLFRGAGGIDLLTRWLRPALDLVGFPPELLPMALVRPLTGSGAGGALGSGRRSWPRSLDLANGRHALDFVAGKPTPAEPEIDALFAQVDADVAQLRAEAAADPSSDAAARADAMRGERFALWQT